MEELSFTSDFAIQRLHIQINTLKDVRGLLTPGYIQLLDVFFVVSLFVVFIQQQGGFDRNMR